MTGYVRWLLPRARTFLFKSEGCETGCDRERDYSYSNPRATRVDTTSWRGCSRSSPRITRIDTLVHVQIAAKSNRQQEIILVQVKTPSPQNGCLDNAKPTNIDPCRYRRLPASTAVTPTPNPSQIPWTLVRLILRIDAATTSRNTCLTTDVAASPALPV